MRVPKTHSSIHDRGSYNSQDVSCSSTRGVDALSVFVCVCARAHISPRYESLIFISKNFFNKKVAGLRAPSTSCTLCSGGFSYRQVYILYKGGGEVRVTLTLVTADRGALKVLPGAHDIS